MRYLDSPKRAAHMAGIYAAVAGVTRSQAGLCAVIQP